MKIHLVINLMIYVYHSRCKFFYPHTWSHFVRFDFSKILYAMDQREYLSRERSSVHEGERVSVQRERERERESETERDSTR